mmetsp:Transcript_56412/g.175422  ORF Transcript_56412/g.175422 Transcript_56412/m.175422 type:complete len:219 (+) Transcript_56412:746-1402(+)
MAEPWTAREAQHCQGPCSPHGAEALGRGVAQYADLPERLGEDPGEWPVGPERLVREGGPRHGLPALPAPRDAGEAPGDRRRHLPHELPRRDLWLLRRPGGHVPKRLQVPAGARGGLQHRPGLEPNRGRVERGPLCAEVHGPPWRGQRGGLLAPEGRRLRRRPEAQRLVAPPAQAALQRPGARAARLQHAGGVLCVPFNHPAGVPRAGHALRQGPGQRT